ncbi:MAG: ECF transporter S component [Crenarchaeota archaeon]|nr:ECF transporter S component [Thermoproteota archaeon]
MRIGRRVETRTGIVTFNSARKVAFIGMMGALSNILFLASITVLNWGQVALDLSHMGTLIAGFFGGPLAGSAVGIIAGLGSGLYFGSTSGLIWLFLPGFIIGKMLTGLTVGLVSRALGIMERRRKGLLTVFSTLLGYVPECLFTVFFFLVIIPLFAPPAAAGFLVTLLIPILAKAWIEMGLMGFYMAALVGNQGFTSLVSRFWS